MTERMQSSRAAGGYETSCLSEEQISLVVDGMAAAEEAAHAACCASCGGQVEELRALGEAFRALPLASERAPASLASTLRGLDAGARSEGRKRWRGVASFAASIAVAAALFLSPGTGGVPEALADEAVTRHLRAFANEHVCEVESGDPRALEDWLSLGLGRDVNVPLQPGVELVGARRCSLFGEQAGAVVYRSGGMPVTMFVPTPGSRAERACAAALGECRDNGNGQTVCVVGSEEAPRVVVGELPADELCQVAAGS